MRLVFKQVRAEGGCLSFIAGDAVTKKAVLIDPRADELDAYEEFLASRKLAVALVIDTHTHADHYSGSHLVAEKFRSPIAMGASTRSARASTKLKDGQSLEIASGLGLEVLETPGH